MSSAIPSMTAANPIASSPAPGCLYCGGQSFRPYLTGVRDRLGHVPGDWAFVACTACGSARLDPWPAESELPNFYPAVYSFSVQNAQQNSWRKRLAGLEYWAFYRQIYEAQASLVTRGTGGAPQGKRLLDLGCGRGLRLLALRRRGFEVHGLDFLPAVVEELQTQHNIPAVAAAAAEAPQHFAANSFDVITAFYLLEHVPDVQGVFRAAWQLLRPGGWFVAGVPLVDSWQAAWCKQSWIHVGEAPRHLSLPTQAGLRAVAEQAGFGALKIGSDTLLECTGGLASSLVRGASITHAYAAGRTLAMARRLFGGALACAALPVVWCESHLAGRPAMGLLYARKP